LFGFNSLSRRMAWSAHHESAIQIKLTIMLINEFEPTIEGIIIVSTHPPLTIILAQRKRKEPLSPSFPEHLTI
jgi:hypothetical protein